MKICAIKDSSLAYLALFLFEHGKTKFYNFLSTVTAASLVMSFLLLLWLLVVVVVVIVVRRGGFVVVFLQ